MATKQAAWPFSSPEPHVSLSRPSPQAFSALSKQDPYSGLSGAFGKIRDWISDPRSHGLLVTKETKINFRIIFVTSHASP